MNRIINLIVILISFSLLGSCTSNTVTLTKQEDNGIKEILKVYGGVCKYSTRYSLSTKDGKKRDFIIELSQSNAIEKYARIVEMPSSNIAYLFYKNVSNQEESYNAIKVNIVFNDKTTQTFEYATKTLNLVMQKMISMDNTVNLLKDRKYDELEESIDAETHFKYDKDQLSEKIAGLDARFGNITGYIPMGFRFNKMPNGEEILHLSAMIKRDIENHEFSMDVSLGPANNEIYRVDYRF